MCVCINFLDVLRVKMSSNIDLTPLSCKLD